MKNKYLGIIIIGMIMLVLLVGTVNAMSTHQLEIYSNIDNFFMKIKYGIQKGLFLFTTWGEANCCAEDQSGKNQHGDYIGYDEFWAEPGEKIDCDDGGCSYDKCAIDYYPDITIYLNRGGPTYNNINWNLWEEEKGEGVSFYIPSVYDWYWVEVYCCPESCEVGDWETKVYVCENNEWDYKGKYGKDDSCGWDSSGCWCNEEDENKYIDQKGLVHCRKPSYSKVNDGTWCPEYIAHYECGRCYNDNLCWVDSDGTTTDDICKSCSNGCITGSNECKENGGNGDESCEEQTGDTGCQFGACSDGYVDIGDYDCSIGYSCCRYEGGNGNGNGNVGDSCTEDSDCITNHCDKKGWWIFGSYKCSPIPWSEIPRLPITRDEVDTMTTQDKLAHICLTSSQCIEVQNYSVSCISIQSLRNDGTIESPGFLSGAKTTIDGIVGSSVKFAIGGAVICGGVSVLAGGACLGSGIGCFTIPAAIGVCTSVTGGAALIGAGVGYSSAQKQIAISEEDPLVEAVQAEDESEVGLCIAQSKGSYCKYTEWAGFFDITGNKCTDGLLIIFGGLIIFLIILRR